MIKPLDQAGSVRFDGDESWCSLRDMKVAFRQRQTCLTLAVFMMVCDSVFRLSVSPPKFSFLAGTGPAFWGGGHSVVGMLVVPLG